MNGLERALTILQEPLDEYYGDRVFFFLDPFGYKSKIAQQIEDVSRDEVHRTATGGPSVGVIQHYRPPASSLFNIFPTVFQVRVVIALPNCFSSHAMRSGVVAPLGSTTLQTSRPCMDRTV